MMSETAAVKSRTWKTWILLCTLSLSLRRFLRGGPTSVDVNGSASGGQTFRRRLEEWALC